MGQIVPGVIEIDVKDEILKTLERNKGAYVSGNALAEKLFVSRNAIWKAIKALKDDGHAILASTNKGYCMARESDVLSAASIEKHLGILENVFSITVFDTVVSTNTTLKEMAEKGAREGTVVISREQSGGRGRQGRIFISPADTGVYFSLLLRPTVIASDATFITTAAAVAAAEAIETVTGVDAAIKWVNDIFCHGKKVCGILTEGSFDMESGGMSYVALGIGINIETPPAGFPDDISSVATAVYQNGVAETGIRSRLVAETLKNFWNYYKNLGKKEFIEPYKARAFIIGSDVDVIAGNVTKKARVLDIDDDCRLIIRTEDGTIEALSSGEVRIKPRNSK